MAGPDSPDDPDDIAGKTPLFAELDKLMSWKGGPVNWDLARQVAVRAAADGDRRTSAAEATEATDALRLADLWLEETTSLPSGLGGDAQAWNRVRWVEATLPIWQTLIDPVAERVVGALGNTLQGGLAELASGGLPPEMAAQLPPGLADMLPADASGFAGMLGPMMGMLSQVGGLLFGTQIGQALGTLAGEVLASSEVGLPLAPNGVAALLPANVIAYAEGLGLDVAEVRLFLALREAAAQRLFAHVPWLRAALLGAVEEYARGITVDPEQLQRSVGALGSLDPSDPEAMQRALGDGLFEMPDTPEQKRALARLETLLALVEGWIDVVVDAAAGHRLANADALQEATRRRRASGGPAEATFATLVGLQLRPRLAREAATLWAQLTTARNIDDRDALWAHPDLLPDADDLDSPAAFVLGDVSTEDLVGDDPIGDIEALERAGAAGPHGADPADASTPDVADGPAAATDGGPDGPSDASPEGGADSWPDEPGEDPKGPIGI